MFIGLIFSPFIFFSVFLFLYFHYVLVHGDMPFIDTKSIIKKITALMMIFTRIMFIFFGGACIVMSFQDGAFPFFIFGLSVISATIVNLWIEKSDRKKHSAFMITNTSALFIKFIASFFIMGICNSLFLVLAVYFYHTYHNENTTGFIFFTAEAIFIYYLINFIRSKVNNCIKEIQNNTGL